MTHNSDEPYRFLNTLSLAVSKIGQEYFEVERFESTPTLRERVYCYELYHQLRRQNTLPYTIYGELDKVKHKPLIDLLGRSYKPDFIFHNPGEMGNNYAVIEVKTSDLSLDKYQEDIDKLCRFLKPEVGYQIGCLLLFGKECKSLDALKSAAKNTGIHVLWHKGVEEMPKHII